MTPDLLTDSMMDGSVIKQKIRGLIRTNLLTEPFCGLAAIFYERLGHEQF